MKKLACFLVLVLTLCACAPTTPVETDTTTKFTARGLTLSIPNEYMDLLLVEVPDEIGFYRYIFSVHEKASVEAGKELYPGENVGGGFLFAIGQVDSEGLQELRDIDMTGAEILATDAQGNYYIYYHPTDVQLLRVEYTDADWEQWIALGEWATQMKQDFLSQNPHLTPYSPEA